MTLAEFIERLEKYSRCKVECRVTRNRTTMLNLLERTARGATLSVHEMFLSAPDEVVASIGAYVRQARTGRKEHARCLKQYIESHYDFYLHHLPKVRTKGKVYDLEELMLSINREYFGGHLQLGITWFRGRGARRTILFGRYEKNRGLIKINECLDNERVPDYFIRFIIYHEMVHHVVPSRMSERGRCIIHGREFKEVERRFVEYERARSWEKGEFFGRT